MRITAIVCAPLGRKRLGIGQMLGAEGREFGRTMRVVRIGERSQGFLGVLSRAEVETLPSTAALLIYLLAGAGLVGVIAGAAGIWRIGADFTYWSVVSGQLLGAGGWEFERTMRVVRIGERGPVYFWCPVAGGG